jgi:hypothetical protein
MPEPEQQNTSTQNKNQTQSIVTAIIIIIVLILLGLTIWNILSINKIKNNVDEDITNKIKTLFTTNNQNDDKLSEIAKIILSYDAIFKLVEGTYTTTIDTSLYNNDSDEIIYVTVEIYPFFDYFKGKNDDTLLPIGKYRFENPSGSKTIKFGELKTKLGIENRNYTTNPLIIHIEISSGKKQNSIFTATDKIHGYILIEKKSK